MCVDEPEEVLVDNPAEVSWLAELLRGVSVDGRMVLPPSCWAGQSKNHYDAVSTTSSLINISYHFMSSFMISCHHGNETGEKLQIYRTDNLQKSPTSKVPEINQVSSDLCAGFAEES